MELIFIPEEIWLIIINYMDTSSFYNTIEALRGIYPELADKLMLYICNYVIREYPKIHLINHLYSNTNFFRIKKNYLQFRDIYTNRYFYFFTKYGIKVGSLKTEYTSEYYRRHVLSLIEKEKDKNTFKNLTTTTSGVYNLQNNELLNYTTFKYKKIKLNTEDIFNYTCNPCHMEYQQLVQSLCL